MSQEDTPAEGQAPEAESTTNVEVKTDSFDAEYVKQLRAEAARHRKEAQEAKARAAEYEDRDKSELEKLTGKLSKQEKATAEAEAKLLRFEVAAEKEVPSDYLDLLVGDSRDELEAKAEKIVQLAKSRNESEREPDFDGGAREPAPEPLSPEAAHNALALKALGIDPNT